MTKMVLPVPISDSDILVLRSEMVPVLLHKEDSCCRSKRAASCRSLLSRKLSLASMTWLLHRALLWLDGVLNFCRKPTTFRSCIYPYMHGICAFIVNEKLAFLECLFLMDGSMNLFYCMIEALFLVW